MMHRGVLFSVFPTMPGISRLKTMVRLHDKHVYDAFQNKRRDIKWAIQNGYQRDLGKDELPYLPSAPAKIAGARILDIEMRDFDTDALHNKRDRKLKALSLIEKYPVKGKLMLQMISSLEIKLNDQTMSNYSLWSEEGELGGADEDVTRDDPDMNPDVADSINDQDTCDGALIGGKDENDT